MENLLPAVWTSVYAQWEARIQKSGWIIVDTDTPAAFTFFYFKMYQQTKTVSENLQLLNKHLLSVNIKSVLTQYVKLLRGVYLCYANMFQKKEARYNSRSSLAVVPQAKF